MGKQLWKGVQGTSPMPEEQVRKILGEELEKMMFCEPINPLIGMASNYTL
jgi:hypothetical protein